MVYSATIDVQGLEGLAKRQAIYALIGLALLFVTAAVDYRLLESLGWFFYALALGLLVAVLVVGKSIYGARRWLDLGLFDLQPSEAVKLLMVIVLGSYFARHYEELHRFRHTLISLLLVMVPIGFIYLQPDLGTAVVLGVIWLSLVWVAGVRFHHLVFVGVMGIIASPFIWFSLKDYMRRRILIFLNPQADPRASYNLEQALISIGSGGWIGKGFARGSQSQLHFLRVRHTDFIFSVIGEELGFIGAVLVTLFLFIIIWRILRAAYLARDELGRLLATGIAAIIFFQSVVNIGMNMGLMPITGIPLPFVSSGGSALITLLLGQGIVQSVVMRRKKIEF